MDLACTTFRKEACTRSEALISLLLDAKDIPKQRFHVFFSVQGQWRGGCMAGVGVRVFSNGTVAAGRWENGKITEKLPLRQCAATVEAASQAAAAARQSQAC